MAVRSRGRLVDAHQHAAAGLADVAVEDFLAVLPDHLLGGHAEELFGGAVDPGDDEVGVVEDQGVRELVEDRSRTSDFCPLGLALTFEGFKVDYINSFGAIGPVAIAGEFPAPVEKNAPKVLETILWGC